MYIKKIKKEEGNRREISHKNQTIAHLIGVLLETNRQCQDFWGSYQLKWRVTIQLIITLSLNLWIQKNMSLDKVLFFFAIAAIVVTSLG